MNQIVIDLPLPAKELSPNSRAHWARKARAVKSYRWAARVSGSAKRPERPWQLASVLFEFTFRDARRRDKDNLLSSMKSAIDGLADAGIVANDSQFTFLPVVIGPPKKNSPGVRIIILEGE